MNTLKSSFVQLLMSSILIFVIISFSPFNSYSDEELNSRAVFYKIRSAYNNLLPKDFIAEVKGNKIVKSLKEIPKSAYCNKGAKLDVKFVFLRGIIESLVVENVKNPYTDRFQPYLDTYKKANIFLKKYSKYEEFLEAYDWEYLAQNNEYHQFKLKRKNAAEDEFLYLYFDSGTFLLIDAYQYSNDKMVGHIEIVYKSKSNFQIPAVLKFKILDKKDKWSTFDLKLEKHYINIGITEDDIIALQDDCINTEEKFIKE